MLPTILFRFDGRAARCAALSVATLGWLAGPAAAQGFAPGLYQPAAVLPVATSFDSRPAAGDADGDGDLDLVLPDAADTGLLLLTGDGTGAISGVDDWAMPPFEPLALLQPALADLDGDGRADLVAVPRAAGSPVRTRLGWFSNVFQSAKTSETGFGPVTRSVLGDLDGDGTLDLVVAQGAPLLQDGAIALARGRGDGTFDPGETLVKARFPRDLALADVDADGQLDAVFIDGGFPLPGGLAVVTLRNLGGAGLVTGGVLAVPGASCATLAELDGDGFPDLLVGAIAGGGLPATLVIARGRGDGAFDPSAMIPLGRSEPAVVAAADLDGDGWPDAVALDARGRRVSLQRLGRGRPVGPVLQRPLPPSGPGAVGLGMLLAAWSGAERPDILATDSFGQVAWLAPGRGAAQGGPSGP